jgi:putative peptidoglycan lipid II flippase
VAKENTGRHAMLVSAGILLSRMMGLVRQRAIATYFGAGFAADAFNAAVKVPNLLQNLFGEGVLSGSFIPVYSRLLAEGDNQEADRVAGAVGAILALSAAVITLVGIAVTPYLMWVIAPGFPEEKRKLTIWLVRILFPGAGLLVCSAWCLGILNSHRKFFLSYTAPVVWNLAMIGTLLAFGRAKMSGPELDGLAVKLAWGTVLGCLLQFGVQLPVVLRLAQHLRFRAETHSPRVREVIRNFAPVVGSRGVVQLSGWIDLSLASFLPQGTLAVMGAAQSLYTLPVGLFGMAVSAAELPAMSSAIGTTEEIAARLRLRLDSGLRQIAFFIVPSAMAFFVLGDVLMGLLYESGRFTHADSVYGWKIVAGSAVGLLASTLGRLYSSTYYALRDTRTPLNYAVVRVVLTTVLGVAAVFLPRLLGIDAQWGAAGLTASAGVAGWVEFTLLRRKLNARIGSTGLPAGLLAKLWGGAAMAAAAAWAVKLAMGARHPVTLAIPVLGMFGLVYFGATYAMKVPECAGAIQRLARLRR